MHPTETRYTLMQPRETERVLEVIHKHGFENTTRLGFPTVIAKRKGKIIGVLSTRETPDAIVAGPLVVVGEIKGPVAMRLVEAFEAVLRMVRKPDGSPGIECYLFVAPDPTWQSQIERAFGVQHYAEENGNRWYRRNIFSAPETATLN